jgi:hypothetical protein
VTSYGGWAIIPEIRVFDVGTEWGLMHSDSRGAASWNNREFMLVFRTYDYPMKLYILFCGDAIKVVLSPAFPIATSK